MEELFVCAILFCEGFAAETEYRKELDEQFLADPENEHLLWLEWETDMKKSIIYVRNHMDFGDPDGDRIGRILMERLREIYESSTDLQSFADRMYRLWRLLPGTLQDIDPFRILSYGDEPLSWGDEAQTRSIYEYMFDYYRDLRRPSP